MKKPSGLTILIIILAGVTLVAVSFSAFRYFSTRPVVLNGKVMYAGIAVDSLDGVYVYYNGYVNKTHGRNLTEDGYNIGLKYQCVEFVKRYYLEHYGHRMPDSHGHARDFFDRSVEDGQKNMARDLLQFTNPSIARPQKGDLLVLGPVTGNRYGHVAIISCVNDKKIEIIQQNPGRKASSRTEYDLEYSDGKWRIGNKRVLGWLRKE